MKKVLIGLLLCFFALQAEASAPFFLQANFFQNLWNRLFEQEKKDVWRTIADFALEEDTRENFRSLHEQWEKDFRFWVGKRTDESFITGILSGSDMNSQILSSELEQSVNLIRGLEGQPGIQAKETAGVVTLRSNETDEEWRGVSGEEFVTNINQELSKSFELGCQVCQKQRASLQTCPQKCSR